MKEGDVVIVAMPQANRTIKNRPSIILREMPPFQDMLVCGVSSQLHQGFDETIAPADSDFAASSLVGALMSNTPNGDAPIDAEGFWRALAVNGVEQRIVQIEGFD